MVAVQRGVNVLLKCSKHQQIILFTAAMFFFYNPENGPSEDHVNAQSLYTEVKDMVVFFIRNCLQEISRRLSFLSILTLRIRGNVKHELIILYTFGTQHLVAHISS